jgi:hypothetical protein
MFETFLSMAFYRLLYATHGVPSRGFLRLRVPRIVYNTEPNKIYAQEDKQQ